LRLRTENRQRNRQVKFIVGEFDLGRVQKFEWKIDKKKYVLGLLKPNFDKGRTQCEFSVSLRQR
jgi:hypothetical protein